MGNLESAQSAPSPSKEQAGGETIEGASPAGPPDDSKCTPKGDAKEKGGGSPQKEGAPDLSGDLQTVEGGQPKSRR